MRHVVDRALKLILLANYHLFFGNLIAAHFPIFFTRSTFSYSPPSSLNTPSTKQIKSMSTLNEMPISPANSPTAIHLDSGVHARAIKERQGIKNNTGETV